MDQNCQSACSNEDSVLAGEPPIVRLLHEGAEDEALQLLQREHLDPNTKTKGGYYLLHMAALSDLAMVTKALVQMGADVNVDDGKGHTPLHYAASQEALDTIKVLAAVPNAELNAQTTDEIFYLGSSIPMYFVGGRTPLHISAEKGYLDCVKLLVAAGADATSKDYSGRDAYDIAVNCKHLDVASFLRPGVTEHVSRLPPDPVADRQGIKERVRRKQQEEAQHYRQYVKDNYKPLHPHLFSTTEDMFDEIFLSAIKQGTEEALRSVITEVHPHIFVFPMLNLQYCKELLEELDNLESSGIILKRPNSMNNYGVILNDIGLEKAMYDLMEHYIKPLSSFLFPLQGQTIDRHHSFVVKYKIGEDLDLKEHVDDSEITLNVCLGKSFKGGDLYFNGILGTDSCKKDPFVLTHRPGIGVLHLGKHWHSAQKIAQGERWNLIVWCRSSVMRGQRANSKEQQPSLKNE